MDELDRSVVSSREEEGIVSAIDACCTRTVVSVGGEVSHNVILGVRDTCEIHEGVFAAIKRIGGIVEITVHHLSGWISSSTWGKGRPHGVCCPGHPDSIGSASTVNHGPGRNHRKIDVIEVVSLVGATGASTEDQLTSRGNPSGLETGNDLGALPANAQFTGR